MRSGVFLLFLDTLLILFYMNQNLMAISRNLTLGSRTFEVLEILKC